MYQTLDTVTLKSGEVVEAGVIHGPDAAWAERLVQLLWHKGDPWNWQNAQLLEQKHPGVDAFFYVLHRDGQPLANIMTVECQGVGHFGHVWTVPEDRQKGASSALMALQMQHFGERGGQALFLGTGYGSVAYQMYARFGFQSVEAESGYMAYYHTTQADFEHHYFARPEHPDEVVVQPLQWSHWPASAALFLGDFPGVVRCIRAEIFGRASSEGGLLPLLIEGEKRQQQGKPPATVVLQNQITRAVVGLATCHWHPIWPESYLLDLYCHPAYWDQGAALLEALKLPTQHRVIAYNDRDHHAKQQVLTNAGFREVAQLPQWLPRTVRQSAWVDVTIFRK